VIVTDRRARTGASSPRRLSARDRSTTGRPAIPG